MPRRRVAQTLPLRPERRGGRARRGGSAPDTLPKRSDPRLAFKPAARALTCLRPLTPAWRRNVEDQTARLGLTWIQIPHQRDEPEPEPVWHVVPWSACTPVVRLYRPVTTNRSDACLIRINVLLSLPARRRGDISTPGRQNSPFFVLSLFLSLFSSPEKTAARNKGRRVSRNVRAAAGEVRSRRIPPHLRTYFFLSPACFTPSRSVTPPPPEGGGPERLVTCPKLSPRMVSPPRRTQNRLFSPTLVSA